MKVVRSIVFAVIFYGWSTFLSPLYVPFMLLPRRGFWFMAWMWVRSCLVIVETVAGIRYEVRVMSAHRDPEKVREYCHAARMRGLKAIIAGAGMSAALPGVAAAHTDLPVIGVPILGKTLGGLDALLSAVQMPPGVPVACVAIDGAKNAGLLAARIINA